ncbi:MAG TPA: VOC family protein [Actinopolymorphaceae bacterium]|jgi:predicted 3-demethylubiquinone-9 3-methyltransferase (glyoxalase superfamily)
MSSITTYLWFDDKGEEAAEFYTSLIKNSRITDVGRGPDGKVLVVTFELDGQQFGIINGGPHFPQTEAVSIFVACESQEEIDYLWDKLLEGGGEESQCGWLKDRYGVSWQIVPAELPKLVTDPNPVKAKAAADAMYPMKKIDFEAIKKAYEQA